MDFEKAQIDLTNHYENNKNIASSEVEEIPEFKINSIECLGANLQLMFTLMKESIRKSIDPSFLIKAIGLDKNIQQVLSFLLVKMKTQEKPRK
jgi:hypothetical protein